MNIKLRTNYFRIILIVVDLYKTLYATNRFVFVFLHFKFRLRKYSKHPIFDQLLIQYIFETFLKLYKKTVLT